MMEGLPDFKRLFESAPDLYLVLDPGLRIVAVSEAFTRTTRTCRVEILGKKIFEVFPDNPDDPSPTGIQNLRASFQRVLSHRASDAMAVQRYDLRRLEGESGGFEEHYWSLINTPVLAEDGSVAWIILRAEEVTEFVRIAASDLEQNRLLSTLCDPHQAMLKLLKDALAARQDSAVLYQRLHALLQAMPIGILFSDDPTCRHITGNPKLLAQFEILTANTIMASGPDPAPPERRVRYYHQDRELTVAELPLQRAVATNAEVESIELEIEMPGGRRWFAEVSGAPVRDAQGNVTAGLAIVVDITRRKLAETSLLTSQRTVRTLSRAVEQSPMSVVITSPTGDIQYVNPKFTEITGYSPEDALGKNPRLLKSGIHPPEFYKQMWEMLTAGREWRGELCNRKKNGELYWEFAVIAPILNKQGIIRNFVGLKADITDRKRLEQEVLEITAHEQRRLGQDLHDDICQWLAGTVLLARTLAKDIAKESPAFAAQAMEISEYTQHTLDSLRLLARGLTPAVIESEGLPCALLKLAANVRKIFHIRCSCDCAGTMEVRDQTAALHLYRIAQEAVSNAVRHGGAREVAIRLQPRGDRVELSVRDDGCGMPQPLPKTSGIGLRTMGYRAGIIGGTLAIRPEAAGGTEIVCTFPKGL